MCIIYSHVTNYISTFPFTYSRSGCQHNFVVAVATLAPALAMYIAGTKHHVPEVTSQDAPAKYRIYLFTNFNHQFYRFLVIVGIKIYNYFGYFQQQKIRYFYKFIVKNLFINITLYKVNLIAVKFIYDLKNSRLIYILIKYTYMLTKQYAFSR